MQLEPYMVKRLQYIDPKLDARWLPGIQRWGVFRVCRRLTDPVYFDGMALRAVVPWPIRIMVVKNKDGSFRPFDHRVLDNLVYFDIYRFKKPTDLTDEIDGHNERLDDKWNHYMNDMNKVGAKAIWDRIHGKKSVDMGANL